MAYKFLLHSLMARMSAGMTRTSESWPGMSPSLSTWPTEPLPGGRVRIGELLALQSLPRESK